MTVEYMARQFALGAAYWFVMTNGSAVRLNVPKSPIAIT